MTIADKDDSNAARLARALLRTLEMPEGEDRMMALGKIRLFAQEIVESAGKDRIDG